MDQYDEETEYQALVLRARVAFQRLALTEFDLTSATPENLFILGYAEGFRDHAVSMAELIKGKHSN